MAPMTAADVMMEVLMEWGVDTIFGLPGDGINGIMEALRKRRGKIRFIQVRHEEAAAFAACGYSKFTGRLGVCLATSGPGGIHLLNGLYDAKLDGASVLAITGLQFHDLINTHSQQDVELDKLFENVAVYSTRIMGPTHVENVTELACRKAISHRSVAHITIPVDFQTQKVTRKNASQRNIPRHSIYGGSHVVGRSTMIPNIQDIERAAGILNEGKKIAILAGRGALDATEELLALAEVLGAPIIKPLLGKSAVPDDSIYTTGGIGLLGTAPSEQALQECDTLIMVGTSFPYTEFMPKPNQAKAVQIDIEPDRIGLRYPVEVGMVGDSKRALQALLPLLRRNEHRQFLYQAQAGMKNWWELMQKRGERMSMPMKPQVVAWELGKRLSSEAIVSCDSGTVATWYARQIPARQGQMYALSGNLGTMACGLPYAIGAQVAYPERQCVAFVGDGAFSMLMADFSTCVKYNLPVKVIVLKNDTLGQIKWEQIVFLGNPEFGCDLVPINFAQFARDCGGMGFSIDDPKKCGEILTQALHTPGPAIIEAVTDPFEPPMPSKIKTDQVTLFAKALARGEPDRSKIVKTVLKDKIREMI